MFYMNERKFLIEDYYNWLKKVPNVKDCLDTFIFFLNAKNYLNEDRIIDENEHIRKLEDEYFNRLEK